MIRILVCLIASAALALPATTPKVPPAASLHLSDAQIEQTIKAKLAKSKIGADHFKIKVQGGIAYWDGFTNVMQHKGAATRMAKTAGAKAVVNHIQISDAAKQKARDRLESGRRRAAVIQRNDPRTEAARSR